MRGVTHAVRSVISRAVGGGLGDKYLLTTSRMPKIV